MGWFRKACEKMNEEPAPKLVPPDYTPNIDVWFSGPEEDAERIRQAKDGDVVEVKWPDYFIIKPRDMPENPEMDAAVAKAIGWQRTEREVTRNQFDEITGTTLEGWWEGDKYVAFETPQFSTNLSAAFAAAEKVSSNYFALVKSECSKDAWECKLNPADRWQEWARAPTPALAICAAILKLKGENDD